MGPLSSWPPKPRETIPFQFGVSQDVFQNRLIMFTLLFSQPTAWVLCISVLMMSNSLTENSLRVAFFFIFSHFSIFPSVPLMWSLWILFVLYSIVCSFEV